MKIFVSEVKHSLFLHTIEIAIPNVHDRTGVPGFLIIEFNVAEDGTNRVRSEHIERELPSGMYEKEWPDEKVQKIIDGFYASLEIRWSVLHP